jgi:hypothetical protein
MRIEGSSSREVRPARRPPERGEGSAPIQAGDSAILSSHSVSPELKALRDGVAALPEVRPEVVAEVAGRLRSGALNTSEAVARTAQALLSAARAE